MLESKINWRMLEETKTKFKKIKQQSKTIHLFSSIIKSLDQVLSIVMRKKVNFEILFKKLAKKHIMKKIMVELKATGRSINVTETGKFNKITEFVIDKIKLPK